MCYRNAHFTWRRDIRLINRRPDCGSWECDECRPKLRAKWIKHAKKCFDAADVDQCRIVTVSLDSYPSFMKRVRRRRGLYFRVLQYDIQTVTIFLFTKDARLSLLGVGVTIPRACSLFAAMVEKIQDSRGGNPISSSRCWALPPRDPPSGWDVVAIGPTPAQIKAAVAVVKTRGDSLLKCADRVISGLKVTVCSGSMTEIDAVCGLLLCPKYPTESVLVGSREITDTDEDCLHSWRGYPDEEPDPYRVGMVT